MKRTTGVVNTDLQTSNITRGRHGHIRFTNRFIPLWVAGATGQRKGLLIPRFWVRIPGDPHMKLHEIAKISRYEPDPSALDRVVQDPNRQLVDTIENKPVYKTKIGNQTIFDIDGQAMLVGVEFSYDGKPAYRIGQLLTKPESRGKGYASALYKSLVVRQRIAAVSDDSLTDGSIAVWRSLAKVCKVKALRKSTGQVIDISSVDDVVNGDPDLLLMAIHESEIPEVPRGILEQMEYYTHPDNHGLWE